jgi:lysophospholipase L1-like esterase
MTRSYAKRLIALPLLAALAACGGGSGSAGVAPIPATHGQNAPHSHSSITARIVGVGDSLTAGYQSNGFLGEPGVRNPLAAPSPLPPGQENGWWALLDEQSSGLPLETAIARMYDPKLSPLPLIKAPGLNDLIVPSSLTPPVPFGSLITGDTCTANHGFNLAGYRYRGMSRVRLDATSTMIRDVGVPGLTLHEANVLHQPQSSTCTQLPGIVGLLNMVVADESSTFWPVLGNFFPRLQGNLTEVNAAASVHPTLATVWLGANDVLKYMGSGGRFLGGDMTPGQVSQDLHQTIGTLQKAGAKVVIANLPNILETGYFQRTTIPHHFNQDCTLRTYAFCLINLATGVPGYILTPYFAQYGLATPHGCAPTSLTKPCGYLTLSGTVTVIQYVTAYHELPDLDCAVPAPKCKPVPGSGLGTNYITPKFAARVQELNNAVNQGINAAATSTHVPLVDIQTIFHGLASGDPSNPYFAAAASISPGVCCTLAYLHGILSFDGLHPSNTGYALVAYFFIKAINQAYHTHIPEVDVKAVYEGTRCSDRRYCFPDPFAPPNDAS